MCFFIFIFVAMQKNTAKKIRKWTIGIAIIYIVCGFALYFLQEKFLFHPQKLEPGHQFSFTIPFKEINLPFNDKKNLSIIQFTVPDSVRKGIVLYFHGNMKNIERYAPFAIHFTRNNYEVWMMDYPGFGKSTGSRSEQIIYNDALQLYKMARARVSKDSIIIYGKSIGTGVASQLAAVRNCKRLILETPYCSIDALFKHYAFIYPVRWMTKYHFPSYDYFNDIQDPITIFHGTDDGTIPFTQAKKLMKRAKPGDELIALGKGEHNNLADFPLFQHKLDSLLQLP
jgi:uncharacterized protein